MAPRKEKNLIIILSAFLIVGSFLFFSAPSAKALLNSYSKPYNGTLSATEWNNLDDDFLNRTGSASMEGPLGITAGGLTVNGSVSATSFVGSMSARNISSGIFGANQGGGNFSFPGYLGVGNSNPVYDLDVLGDVNFTGSLYQNGSPFVTGQWNTNGSSIFYNSGNVGIGISAPQRTLDLSGTFRVSSQVTFSALDVDSNALVMVDGDGNLYSAENPEGTLLMPTGTSGGTLRHNGTTWLNNTLLYNNGTNIGIGTTNPGSLLTLANDSWLSAINGAGTGVTNMFKVNTNNQIEVGAPLLIGPLEFAENSGLVSFLDMPVTSSATVGTPEGYSLKVDGNNLLTLYSQSDGSGGIQNSAVGIGVTNPSVKFEVGGVNYIKSFASTVSGLGGAGDVLVMADNSGSLYSTTTSAIITPIVVDSGGWTANGSTVYKTNNSGNVGIGVSNPDEKLVVSGTGSDFKIDTDGSYPILRNSNGDYLGVASDIFVLGGKNIRTYGDSTKYMYFKHDATNGILGTHTTGGDIVFAPLSVERMRILENGNVGIGTTSPGSKLDVWGVGSLRSIRMNPGDSGYILSSYNASAGNIEQFNIKHNYGNVQIRNERGDLNLFSSNVGINTTDPTTKLDVSGTFRNTLATTHSLLGGAGNAVVMSDNTGTLYSTGLDTFLSSNTLWSGTRNGNIWNGDAGVGNVGIGTSNPQDVLDLGLGPSNPGNLRLSTYGYFGLLYSSGSLLMGYNVKAPTTLSSSPIVANTNSVVGYSYIKVGYSSGISFFTQPGSVTAGDVASTERMRIAYTGNVGIGTTGPDTKLDVSGTFRNTLSTTHSLLGGAGNAVVMADNTGTLYSTSTDAFISSNSLGLWSGTKNGAIWNGDAGVGNVGIGTTNPSAALHVNYASSGNAIFQVGTGDGSANNDIKLGYNGYGWYWRYYGQGSGDGNELQLWSEGAGGTDQQVYAIRQSGNFNFLKNVGIGTTNPTLALDVVGAINATTYARSGAIVASGSSPVGTVSGQSNVLMYNLSGTVGRLLAYDGSSYYDLAIGDYNGGNPNIMLKVGGNVGISNGSPATKLDVSGTFRNTLATTHSLLGGAGNAVVMADNTGTLYSTSTDAFISSNSLGLWSGTKNGNIWNGDAGVGNVGIGTSSPNAKLAVSGAVKIGSTADTCDASKAGTFRYDAGSFNGAYGQTYLCDGARWVNQNNCGLISDDNGNVYTTVQIGGQCWMAENMNVGTMLASVSNEPNTSDQVIEKWCYDDSAANCEEYGGLYNWDEVMRGSKVAGAQGICPSGWHIPTDAEFYALEKTVLNIIDSPEEQLPCSLAETGDRCADYDPFMPGGYYGVGRALKALNEFSGIDLVGFNFMLYGLRHNSGFYYGINDSTYELNYSSLWSSTEDSSTNVWYRSIGYSSPISRSPGSKLTGRYLRCLRD